MRIDKKLVDYARRDLLKLAAMTGTAGIITSLLGESLTPTLAFGEPQKKKPGGAAKPGAAAQPKLNPIENDIAIANIAIQLEQKAINTYYGMEKEKVIANKQVVDVAHQFTADHLAHRDALIKAVTEFQGTPAPIKGLGTFPIAQPALKKEAEAVRYALTLEMIASKIYFDAFKDKLRTPEGRNLIITILPVETQHVGVFRALLKLVLDKNNQDNQLVNNSLLEEEPTPEMPQGFAWDFEKLS